MRFSDYFKFVRRGERGIIVAESIRIPVRHRRYIVLQRKVSAVTSPAECLYGNFQIVFKINGVGNVPTIHIKISLRAVGAVCRADFRQTRIGCCEFCIFSVYVKIIGSAKVIFRARAANRRELFVAVDIEFYLAFAPPAVGFYSPVEIGAYIMSPPLNSVQNSVNVFVRKRVYTPELCVEI